MLSQSMDSQISRILTSDTSQHLLSQLQDMNSKDSRIEVELEAKTSQIYQLQNYLKNQIQNIQALVEQNSQFKKQIDFLQKQAVRKSQDYAEASQQLQHIFQRNKNICSEMNQLQRKNLSLQMELRQFKCKQIKEQSVQTDTIVEKTGGATNRSSNTSPAYNKQNQNRLLEKISVLEETIVELKLEKSELVSKMNSMPPLESPLTTEQQYQAQQSVQIRPTDQIISAICQDQLEQIKFKGQIVNGLKQGKGSCQYQQNIHFQGHFHQGRRHGLGTLFVFDEVIYRGFWYQGFIQGKGIMHMLQGQIQTYEGQFYQGRLEGYGCMSLKSGKRIVGFWQDGKIQGNCMQSDQRSKKYIKPELIQCY